MSNRRVPDDDPKRGIPGELDGAVILGANGTAGPRVALPDGTILDHLLLVNEFQLDPTTLTARDGNPEPAVIFQFVGIANGSGTIGSMRLAVPLDGLAGFLAECSKLATDLVAGGYGDAMIPDRSPTPPDGTDDVPPDWDLLEAMVAGSSDDDDPEADGTPDATPEG